MSVSGSAFLQRFPKCLPNDLPKGLPKDLHYRLPGVVEGLLFRGLTPRPKPAFHSQERDALLE
jgi:hypothetical protein